MRCTSRSLAKLISITVVFCLILCGCNNNSLVVPFDYNSSENAYSINSGVDAKAVTELFARDICITDNNFGHIQVAIDEAEAGGLFDVTDATTLYAKNVHERMNPASLTKVMTAYIALKYGHLEDSLTASSNVVITESGAQLLGLKEGCHMNLEQALYALMLYSANDAAVMIAEYLSGSVESFAAVMNDEAKKLGATNTHFTNPHGLTNDEHYTTAYDLYLIFNAAMQYETFRKIINTSQYTVVYRNANGDTVEKDVLNTNSYLNGEIEAPNNVGIIGGKTGTTKAAGSCLILLSNSSAGHTYVSVILHSTDHSTLYNNMNSVLSDIP